MNDDPRDRHRERTHDERAGDRCPSCGRAFATAERADVHHRDGDPTNGAPENLRKRCKRCHLGDEHDRDVKAGRGPPGVRRTGPTTPRTTPR